MKSVTEVSSKPICLSKAASTLSSFLSANDNGASQAVCAFLRRASTSFDELKKLHKELKPLRFDQKHRHLRVEMDVESSDGAILKRKGTKKHKKKSEDGYGKIGDDDRDGGARAKRRR